MVGGNKSHTPFDSRLLLSLVKCEKEVADSFKSYTQTCENANNALNGWAAADTGDSPDVLTASNRVCELFDETFDAQRTYLMALNNYRSSLKDVAAREAEIRVILRDRDIFVSRLVKLNNKKPPTSDAAFEAHTAKLEEARAELAACESTLKAEERALVGVKRRIFREALRMRMRAMAQLADTWRDTAERAIDILDSLDADNNANGSMTDLRLRPQPPPPTQIVNTPSRHSGRLETFQSPEGSVIAPSHSASQVARRAAGIPADYSDDEGDTALGGVRDTASLHRSASMNDRRTSNLGPPIQEVSREEEMASGEGLPARGAPVHNAQHQHHQQQYNNNAPIGHNTRNGANNVHINANGNRIDEDDEEGGGSSEDERGREMDPKLYQVHVNKPLTPRELAQQKARQILAQKQSEEGGQAATHQAQQLQQSHLQNAQPFPSQQQQQQQQPAVNGIASPTATVTAPKKRLSMPVTSPSRETPEERQKRFSTLNTAVVPPYEVPTAPLALPSATTHTIDAYKKKHAPEATLVLPSSTASSRGYKATRADDSDEEAVDELGDLQTDRRRRAMSAGTPSRPAHGRTFSQESGSVGSDGRDRRVLKTGRTPSGGGRDSAYYSRSDAGASTVRGGDKRDRRDKNRSDGSQHKSGGFFGAVTGLFKKRDLQSRNYHEDDDDDDSVLGSPKSRGTASRSERNSSVFKKKKSSSRSQMDDSDSDAPDPRTLIRVQNNGGRNGRSSALSDTGIDRNTEAAIRAAVNSNTFSSIPPDRKKALSDVGAPRTVKKKSTTSSAALTSTGLDRKGSVKSTATTASAPGTVVKKKKKVVPASSPTSGIIASASSPSLSRSGTLTQNPAQRVTRDTPSLMSVVAPPSQSAYVMNMPLPSAKNPSASAMPKPATPSGSALGIPSEPLKKKKTVKRSSTMSNVNGNLLVPGSASPAMKASSTSPNLLSPVSASTGQLKSAVKPSSIVAAPRPASILSVGSGGASGVGVARRKSVRLADDTKLTEAKYENAGGPANIPRVPSPQPQIQQASHAPVPNGSAHHGILKESHQAVELNHNAHDYSNAGVTAGAGLGEWTRAGADDDVSSDEGGDEYARIKHQLSRSDRSWKEAGFLDKGKGKARAP